MEIQNTLQCAKFTNRQGGTEMVYKEQLQSIYSDMQRQKSLLEKEQDYLPDGYLNIRTYNQKSYYTWQIPKGGRRKKTFRKGITKDKEQVNKLVRKRYLDDAIIRINKDIRLLEALLSQYKEIDEGSVMKEYIQKHPDLKDGLRYGNMSDEEWMARYSIGSILERQRI